MSERWPVEIAYRVPGGRKALRYELEPYLVHCHAGTVYVVGRVPARKGLRTFALARIKNLRVQDERNFEPDPAFDADRFIAEAFGGFHQGKVEEVVLRFEAPVAPVVRERIWHPSQQIRELPRGAIELSFRTAGPTGVLVWSRSFAPHVRILAPDWLAKEQREEVEEWGRTMGDG